MKMHRDNIVLGFVFVALIGGVVGQQGFVFEGEARRRHRPSQNVQYDSAGEGPGATNRPGVNPSTIDNIFQIPIAIIQGTSSVAQSWRPESGETINKVFDIPVQTLQAVGNLIRDRVEQQSANSNAATKEELKYQRRQQRLEEHKRLRDLQRVKRQEDAQARRHHSFYNPISWTNALADVLVGHGGLFSGHGGHDFFGNHNDLFSGHMKKKKKKKKPHFGGNNGGHFGGGHFGGQNGHFGGHGGHFGGGGHKPIVSQILGGDGHVYQVHENLDDIPPPADLFPWNRRPRIQNKIAPRFEGQARSV